MTASEIFFMSAYISNKIAFSKHDAAPTSNHVIFYDCLYIALALDEMTVNSSF